MSTKPLFTMLLASVVAMPTLFVDLHLANAQKTLSRQHIVNGLQRKKSFQPRQRVIRQHSRQKKRVVRRRAPQKQTIQRAPQQQFRAPGKVVKRRAPQQFRVPGKVVKRRAPRQEFRAPPRVAERRAPEQFRAPGNTLRNRAPQRNPGQVATRRAPEQNNQRLRAPEQNQNALRNRAPDRIPQQFEPQIANNNPTRLNQRAINIEAAVTQQINSASVDLEILFDYNSDRIKPESIKQLVILGEALLDPSLMDSRILIAGHTDAAGSNRYNMDLSYRRARSVTEFLINFAGIDPARLAIEGYGEEMLKYPDAPNSGQNRRVEIINMGG